MEFLNAVNYYNKIMLSQSFEEETRMQTVEPVIQLQLPVSEVNFVLGLVGKQPYDQAAGLIDKIRGQAAPQLVAFAQQQQEQAADDILAAAQAFRTAMSGLRSARLIDKEGVRNAVTDTAADQAYQTAIASIRYIRSQVSV